MKGNCHLVFIAAVGLVLYSCKETAEAATPVQPEKPADLKSWAYAISDLSQHPGASVEFTNLCPVFSPDGKTAYYQSTGKNVIAVDVATGKIKWQTNETGDFSYEGTSAMTQPAVNPVTGEIYVNFHISKTETNVFFSLDPSNGKILKKLADVGIFAGNISGPAVSADGKLVYIGTNGKTVRVVDTDTFEVVGTQVIYSNFRHILVEGDKSVLIGDHDEIIVCIYKPEEQSGKRLIHSDPVPCDSYYAVPASYPCFSSDGKRVLMPASDVEVFAGATPTKGYVLDINIPQWYARMVPVQGSENVWSVISDKDGNIYVTASSGSSSEGGFIRKYSPDLSTEIWTWTVPSCLLSWRNGLSHCTPAIGEDGKVYVLSRENNCIYSIDSSSGKGEKLLLPPVSAFPNKAQFGVNICEGKLITAFSGLRSGVVAGADIGTDMQKAWACAVGDPCGTKCYETVWGKGPQINDSDLAIGAQNAFMFDACPNDKLRGAMLSFLDDAAAKVPGTTLATDFAALKADVQSKMDKEPYAWIDQTNTFVTKTIARYTPMIEDASEPVTGDRLARHLLLLLRDYPLHEVSLNNDAISIETAQKQAFDKSVAELQSGVVGKLLDWLDTPAPKSGVLEVFKIYNMGYVVRTAEHCYGIDIFWWGNEEQMRCLCDHIEAIFVSHAHGDHFNLPLLTEMSGRNGKHLFMTAGTKAMFSPGSEGTLHVWDEDHLEAEDCSGLRVSSVYGAQGDLPCNLYCAEADGFCLWFCGDNGKTDILSKAKASFPAAHVTMVSLAGPSGDLNAAAREAKNSDGHKSVYILSHENEVHHTIDGRVSYKYYFEATRMLREASFRAKLGNYSAMDYGELLTITAPEGK